MAYSTLNHRGIDYVRVGNLKRTEIVTGQSDFHIRDQKHRAIGYVWNIHSVTCTPVSKDEFDNPSRAFRSYDLLDCALPFNFYEMRANVTRNGHCYGASQGSRRFATLEAAKQALDKTMEASRKNYSKKFGSFTA
jgi:hypothetical protein